MSRLLSPVLVAASLGLAAGVARATPPDTYGAFARGVSTAGALTAAADDATAAWYNPAGLGLAAQLTPATSITIGYASGIPFTTIDREKTDSKIETRAPTANGWATVGAFFPLGGKLENKAGLGLMLYHPQDKLLRVEALDPKNPQWSRFQANPDRLVLTFGLGARLGSKVALGLGVSVLTSLGGDVHFDIELFEKRVERRDISFAIKTAPSAIAGLTITPTDALRLALVYRQANELTVSQPNEIGLGDIGTLVLDVTATVHYTPHEFALGFSYDVSERMRLTADVKAQLWNLSPNPAVQVAVSLTGEVPEALGLDKALAFETTDPATGFTPTFNPSLAFEYLFPDKVTKVRGGYGFRPTYVPLQVQSTSNYLDNTAHILGLGATFQFSDPTEVFSKPLKLDLGGQFQLFQPRTVVKKQPNDPVGGYTFGGFAAAFAAAIRYEF